MFYNPTSSVLDAMGYSPNEWGDDLKKGHFSFNSRLIIRTNLLDSRLKFGGEFLLQTIAKELSSSLTTIGGGQVYNDENIWGGYFLSDLIL